MAYDDSTDSGSVATKPGRGQKSEANTFWLPEEAVAELSPDVKPGDILEYRVVGKDADGQVEVEYSKPDEKEKDFDTDMAESMPPEAGGTYQKPEMTE